MIYTMKQRAWKVKYILLCTVLTLSGCMSVSGTVRAVEEWQSGGERFIMNRLDIGKHKRDQELQRNQQRSQLYGECIAETDGPGVERDKCLEMME